MLDCRHASQLLSQSMDRRLSFRQRMMLRFHLMMCDACTQFSRQLRVLRSAIGQLGRRMAHDESQALPTQARERIAAAVAIQARQNDEARRNPDHDTTD
jgi:hypothetical protein